MAIRDDFNRYTNMTEMGAIVFRDINDASAKCAAVYLSMIGEVEIGREPTHEDGKAEERRNAHDPEENVCGQKLLVRSRNTDGAKFGSSGRLIGLMRLTQTTISLTL